MRRLEAAAVGTLQGLAGLRLCDLWLHVANAVWQDEVRELSFTATLRALDASWWDVRRELDRYLDAYDGYLRRTAAAG